MIASAPAMQRVLATVDRVISTDFPVVIHGESGTGKELIARAIHQHGARSRAGFVAINCGALNETLLESELFGHAKGAFTGAGQAREGLFEAASGGTLFLDEVGEMSLPMQVKLLRALQEKTIRRVGENVERPIDVRVLAATHRDLLEMCACGAFREDLFYRLATLVLELPPLRERAEDIPLLVRTILEKTCGRLGVTVPVVTGDAVDALMAFDWPGNIRQLENVIRGALVMSDGVIQADTLRPLLGGKAKPRRLAKPAHPTSDRRSYRGRPPKFGETEVRAALDKHNGHRRRSAQELGVSERTFQRYLTKFGLH